MKQIFFTCFLALFVTSTCLSQVNSTNLPFEQTLSSPEQLEILVGELSRITVSLQNNVAEETVVYWSSFYNGKEKPENEIGPKKYRTVTLAPKLVSSDETVRLDRKEVILNTNNADKIVIHVEKGKIHIQVKPSKKSI